MKGSLTTERRNKMILSVILGVQLFLAGFLGELVNRRAGDRNKYMIDETLD